MMDAGVGASVACYRDTFSKGLRDGLTQTLESYNPNKDNFNFAQSKVLVSTYYEKISYQYKKPASDKHTLKLLHMKSYTIECRYS